MLYTPENPEKSTDSQLSEIEPDRSEEEEPALPSLAPMIRKMHKMTLAHWEYVSMPFGQPVCGIRLFEYGVGFCQFGQSIQK